jgi:hypothetical protein
MKAIDDGLFTKLTADSGAGGVVTLLGGAEKINMSTAPQGLAHPHLAYRIISGVPEYTLTQECYRRTVYRFTLTDKGESFDVIKQAADRLETLLNDSALAMTGWDLKVMRLRQRLPDITIPENGSLYPTIDIDFTIEVTKQ